MRGPSLLKDQQVKESNQLGKEAQSDERAPQRKGGKGTEPRSLERRGNSRVPIGSAAIAGQPGFRPVRECLLGFRGLLQRDEIVEPKELSEDAETDKGRFDDRRHVIENRGRIARQWRDNLRPNDFSCNCDSPTVSHPITSYKPDRRHDPSRP